MIKLAILVLCLSLAGCPIICKFDANQQTQASDTLQMLQGSYDVIVSILKLTPNPQVRIAVALTDAALHLVGSVLTSYCPSAAALALAQTTAAQALAAQKAVLGAQTVPVR